MSFPAGARSKVFGQRPRGQIGIERRHGDPGGLKEQDRHQGNGEEGALSRGSKGAGRSHQKRDRGHQQRQPKIGERRDRQVFHVAERELVGARIGAQRRGNVAGRGKIPR